MAYLLQQLLTASARRDPDKEVALCRARALTYQELDETSDRLAGVLRESGIERGDRVGIYLNKSLESLAALFGILKAGGVYVPLDPCAPVKRVAFIVGNCAMKGLVCTPKKIAYLSPALPESAAVRCVVLTDGSTLDSQGGLASELFRPAHHRGRPGLYPLYLWIDRRAQGGDDQPSGLADFCQLGPRVH